MSGDSSLTPLGHAIEDDSQSDEISKHIATRHGRILTAQTMLKSDFFPNLNKTSLPEKIDGVRAYKRRTLLPTNYSSSVPQPPRSFAGSASRRQLKRERASLFWFWDAYRSRLNPRFGSHGSRT